MHPLVEAIGEHERTVPGVDRHPRILLAITQSLDPSVEQRPAQSQLLRPRRHEAPPQDPRLGHRGRGDDRRHGIGRREVPPIHQRGRGELYAELAPDRARHLFRTDGVHEPPAHNRTEDMPTGLGVRGSAGALLCGTTITGGRSPRKAEAVGYGLLPLRPLSQMTSSWSSLPYLMRSRSPPSGARLGVVSAETVE
jgi:hypothetical protein